jgi:hypothetical protein
MQKEDTRVMIGTCLSMFIHERSRIKFASNNDIYKTCDSDMHIVITKHGLNME